MRSTSGRTTSRHGFTLIEIVIVVALVSLVAGFGIVVSMETYRGYSFRSERDAIVLLLQRARSQAQNNVCLGAACGGSVSHGVRLESRQYVLFQGASYAARDADYDETISARYLGVATATPSLTDVVFSPLAATTTANPLTVDTIVLIDSAGADTSTITVNPEGQISWTH